MPKQILVIDDDHNAVKYLSTLLSEHGYDPVPAYDGAEGLQKIKQAKPDLIVLDVMMPKKSGFVLFKQLKQDNEYRDIPIVMLTGVAGMIENADGQFDKRYDSLREFLKKKIDDMREEGLVKPDLFLDKPVDPDDFIARLRKLIGS
ncbi:MAG: response regulator [Planctomycetota bacterium]|jgi:CheY-like chemotaxis protein